MGSNFTWSLHTSWTGQLQCCGLTMHKIIVLGFVTITYPFLLQNVVWKKVIFGMSAIVFLMGTYFTVAYVLERVSKVFIIFTAQTTNCSNQSTDLSKYEIRI